MRFYRHGTFWPFRPVGPVNQPTWWFRVTAPIRRWTSTKRGVIHAAPSQTRTAQGGLMATKAEIIERHDWEDIGTFQWGTTTYQLEHNRNDRGEGRPIAYAYRLTGPRGGQYVLMRNLHHPEQLFTVNAARMTGSHPFRGGWFSDRNGRLEHLS